MSEPRLTDHDQLLVNLVGGLVAMVVPSRELIEADLKEIRLVLPRVSRDSVVIRDLAVACEQLVIAAPFRGRLPVDEQRVWHRAWFDVHVALEQMMRSRARAVGARIKATATAGART